VIIAIRSPQNNDTVPSTPPQEVYSLSITDSRNTLISSIDYRKQYLAEDMRVSLVHRPPFGEMKELADRH
jgi:hypothetical protein